MDKFTNLVEHLKRLQAEYADYSGIDYSQVDIQRGKEELIKDLLECVSIIEADNNISNPPTVRKDAIEKIQLTWKIIDSFIMECNEHPEYTINFVPDAWDVYYQSSDCIGQEFSSLQDAEVAVKDHIAERNRITPDKFVVKVHSVLSNQLVDSELRRNDYVELLETVLEQNGYDAGIRIARDWDW